jgi:hypothetical protein
MTFRKQTYKRKTYLLIAVLLLMPFSKSNSNDTVDTNAKVKAIFIYNIGKYIEWPVTMSSGDFTIALYGDYPSLWQELNLISNDKSIGTQKIKVRKVGRPEEIQNCHMVYVDQKSSSALPQILSKTSGSNILILTDNEGLASAGAGINFFYENSKQRMEINPGNIEKRNLKISTQLLSLAKIIE